MSTYEGKAKNMERNNINTYRTIQNVTAYITGCWQNENVIRGKVPEVQPRGGRRSFTKRSAVKPGRPYIKAVTRGGRNDSSDPGDQKRPHVTAEKAFVPREGGQQRMRWLDGITD